MSINPALPPVAILLGGKRGGSDSILSPTPIFRGAGGAGLSFLTIGILSDPVTIDGWGSGAVGALMAAKVAVLEMDVGCSVFTEAVELRCGGRGGEAPMPGLGLVPLGGMLGAIEGRRTAPGTGDELTEDETGGLGAIAGFV